MPAAQDNVHHLSDLIRRQMVQQNLTQSDVAARSGGLITKQIVQQIVSLKHAPKLPRTETMQGLASGLGVDLDVVIEAALRDAGLWIEPITAESLPPGTRQLVAAAGKVSPEELERVTQLLETMGESRAKPMKPKKAPRG